MSIDIKLPDGSIKAYAAEINGFEFAQSISTSLAKKALALRVNDQLKDLATILKNGDAVEIILPETPEGLEIIRHDAAHVLAQALVELYPDAKLAIGPVIKDGFYYDFESEYHVTEDDLPKIERKMAEIIKRSLSLERFEMSRDEAIKYFAEQKQDYKVEILSDLPEGEVITLYRQGDFVDPCRGPHSPSTSKIKAFKLLSVAGAYWRGDSSNIMLQRIYGTAFASQAEQDEYLERLEEARKRDHRKLGKDMELFHFQEVAPGTVFWHPKGWKIFSIIKSYMSKLQDAAGYQEIATPEIMDRNLWVTTGHADKFDVNMYSATVVDDKKEFTVRPMNCPGGVQVFNAKLRSYKELPILLSEFGKVYRYEPSGALHGLFRARGFTQDDAHIFCTTEQITEESRKVCHLVQKVYKDFGFEKIKVKFADRPDKRIGSDAIWDIAEASLQKAAEESGLDFSINKGEGAFYGPKLEFVLQDAIGRDWQLGTLQLDLNLPERLDVSYVAADGSKQRPVMLHRAVLGSFERFIGILLENYNGNLPLWLAPVQVVVAPISNQFDGYAKEVVDTLLSAGIRVEDDLGSDKISYKIRKHSALKIPVIVIVGKEESESHTVNIRRLGDKSQETLELNEFLDRLRKECAMPDVL